MSNSLITPNIIAKEALMEFKNALGFTKGVDRQYSDEFAVKGAKVGSTINLRVPVRFPVANGATLVTQDVTETEVPLTLGSQKHVAFNFTSKDLTLTVDEFTKRYVKPAAVALANQVDVDGLNMAATNVANTVGTPGTAPATLLTFLQGQQKLNEMACPDDDDRTILINPAAQTTMVSALQGLFQSSDQISEQYERGKMGIAAGATWKMAQNIYSRTVGALGGTPIVSSASQTGASLATSGWSNSVTNVLLQGDVFTIAGVYSVNPITKQSTGSLQSFLVTANVSSNGSGVATIPIYPAITTTTSLQTVTGSPANSAAITVLGAAGTVSPQNLLYHKKAFTLGTADLELPRGVDMAARATDEESGISIRIVRAFDINNDAFPCRLDIVYGWAAMRPEWACRVQG